jgi:hypothetical protein
MIARHLAFYLRIIFGSHQTYHHLFFDIKCRVTPRLGGHITSVSKISGGLEPGPSHWNFHVEYEHQLVFSRDYPLVN